MLLKGPMRAKTWPRAQQLRLQRAYARKKLLVLLGIAISIGVLGVILWFLLPRTAGLIAIGATAASIVWVEWMTIALASGSINARYGVWGEELTRDVLKGIRRQGWRFVQGLAIEHGDIDLLATGPGGVVAIEAKWVNNEPNSHEAKAKAADYLKRARNRAFRAHELLKLAGHTTFVHPVVVVWGHGSKRLVELAADDAIVAGDDLRDWLLSRPATSVRLDRRAIIRHLKQLVSRQRL